MKRKDLILDIIRHFSRNRTELGVRGHSSIHFGVITSLGFTLLICKRKILIPALRTSKSDDREQIR